MVQIEVINTELLGRDFPMLLILQKWYKKAFLNISDFRLIQENNALDISVNELRYRGRVGVLRHEIMV